MKMILLCGISAAAVMAILWSVVFVQILGEAGVGVGIALGVAFGCCGALIGYGIQRSREKDQ